ncbi:MAG TPA: response regulator [Herpetosiphon sp.]|jgi:two-component system, cell cycle response regulator DivK|uniref:Response regulator receiver protein n=2 Tax=Herpetosiphon TaxID=64 RepID=A9B1H8_HERA2|nr:response regulator [Herpetosiphon sp.]ABX03863.1 response regulator receiver protein [Herpetosiphon aurantiacus DSM 785]MCA0351438.1 response regulator [Chloroflexota bacterium]HBW50321.1 response regulator [Herpetosiphon sp.]
MPTILVIEDIPDNAALARRVLNAYGYSVLEAADAASGLDMALEQHPDLILLDLGLPDADGQTVAGVLRGTPETQNIPIVVFTAWPEETARQMVRAYGCNGFIRKPLSVIDFAQAIASYLS